MKSFCLATVLLLSATPVTAQTLDETFDQLGSKLQDVQKSLSPASPAPGTTFQLPSSTPIYTQPTASAATSMKLDANAPVIVHGIENGFAKVTTQGFPGTFYVPQTGLAFPHFGSQSSGQTGAPSDYVKTAFEKVKGVADYLQNNPYVRLKGFSVDISLVPSLKIDLEMRDAVGSSAPAAIRAPQTKP